MKIVFIASPLEIGYFEVPENMKIILTGIGSECVIPILNHLNFDYGNYDSYYNLGTCGAFGIPVGTVVRPNRFQKRHCSFDYYKQQTSNKLVLCTSVEQFVSSPIGTPTSGIVDMEAFDIVTLVRRFAGKDTEVVKIVSDNFDGSIHDWTNNAKKYHSWMHTELKRIIDKD